MAPLVPCSSLRGPCQAGRPPNLGMHSYASQRGHIRVPCDLQFTLFNKLLLSLSGERRHATTLAFTHNTMARSWKQKGAHAFIMRRAEPTLFN